MPFLKTVHICSIDSKCMDVKSVPNCLAPDLRFSSGTFFQRYIFLRGGFLLTTLWEQSYGTMSWSPFLLNGASDLQRNLKAGWLVKTKSSVLSWRVGKSTICSNPKSWDKSRNNWLTRCGYWCRVVVFDFQHIPGRLKSPESIIIDFLYFCFKSRSSLYASVK